MFSRSWKSVELRNGGGDHKCGLKEYGKPDNQTGGGHLNIPFYTWKYLGFLQNQVCSLASLACTILGRKVLPCKMPRRSTIPKCIILGKKMLP